MYYLLQNKILSCLQPLHPSKAGFWGIFSCEIQTCCSGFWSLVRWRFYNSRRSGGVHPTRPPPACRWVKSWSVKLLLDMPLDYCLKLQSPCDDGLDLDLTLTCFAVILCHSYVISVKAAGCSLCVCWEACRLKHGWAVLHTCVFLFFFSFLLTWKKPSFIAAFHCIPLSPQSCDCEPWGFARIS